ncbi:MAG TPA: hypothetical protein VE954_30035 [Oligoflexus sp.]|uniref:hypothetical protein n=1 Tax=Oligoflexus sp. TaxID=1971216 RepID=UPI002D6D16EC|nr:hypothetical protein [Oligoflexus sp.]HYX37364.1 hypothetical protein [Oligoflexus sp.]
MRRTSLACLFSLAISASTLFAQNFESPFPLFDGTIRVPVGNHGSTTVEIVNQTQLKTIDGYGPRSEENTLDLTNGILQLTTVDFIPRETKQTTRLLPADQGGAYLPYRKQLQAMIGDLTWVTQNLHFLGEVEQKQRQPQMAAVLQYLNTFLAQADAKAPDSINVNPLPRDLRRGIPHSISVEYLARDDRDLLLEVFDGQWSYLEGTRVRVPAGHKTVDVLLTIPANAPMNQPGFITAKLVPVDGEWSDYVAEVKQSVTFKKTQMITSASASYINFNSPRVGFYINYYCAQGCDVRVDIFDAQGQWLATQTVPANAPYTANAEQFSSLYVEAPVALLPAGQSYTYYAKILPQGGTWDQYFDEISGTFITSN